MGRPLPSAARTEGSATRRCRRFGIARTPRPERAAEGREGRRVVGTAAGGSSPRSSKTSHHWSSATVVENRSASADGSFRTLVLSIDDDVRHLKGRKFGKIPSLERLETKRWIDDFVEPGQYILCRAIGDEDGGKSERVHLSSTPYEAHKESAFLSASIVQILVNRSEEGGDLLGLGNLGPGDQFEASEVSGNGFQSLFQSYDEESLDQSMEEGKSLVMIASGKGIGPMRSVLDWTPVQAYSSGHNLTLLHVIESLEVRSHSFRLSILAPLFSPLLSSSVLAWRCRLLTSAFERFFCLPLQSAPYIDSWDSWREGGIHVRPCLGEEETTIEKELFDSEGRIREGVIRTSDDPHFLVSGFAPKVTARLNKLLVRNGMNQIFYCEY